MIELHVWHPVDQQVGRYNSAEHESLRAVARCASLHFGDDDAYQRIKGLLNCMGVRFGSELSPSGARYCRVFLERQLPECNA